MVVVSSVARFMAEQLAVLCSPLKGNWVAADPVRRRRARVESNIVKSGVCIQPATRPTVIYELVDHPQC